MQNDESTAILENATVLTDGENPEVIEDLAGYQVTRGELFSHIREPAITIWDSKIKFNMACLRRFPGITHIQVLINPEQKKLIIRPSNPDAPDALRWAKGGGEKELQNRDLLCRIFAAKVFDLMGWDRQYRYKVMGKIAVCNKEVLFLFNLYDFELFTGSKTRKSFLPGEWRDYFGMPVEEHDESYKIDLADGYISTDKV